MDYVAKVFDLLEIKPQERFLLFNNKRHEFEKDYYHLTNKLDLWYLSQDNYYRCSGVYNIIHILNGTVQITKIPQVPKEEEKIAIRYAQACGCKWIAKNRNDMIHAFKNKPKKNKNMWFCDDVVQGISVHIPISFLAWEDSEPYYIGD